VCMASCVCVDAGPLEVIVYFRNEAALLRVLRDMSRERDTPRRKLAVFLLRAERIEVR